MAVCGYKYRRATDNRCSADSLDKGGGDILIADPDGVTITWYALNAEANIDIIAFERRPG